MKKTWTIPSLESLNVEYTANFVQVTNDSDGVYAGITEINGKPAPLDGFECAISCS